MNPYPFNIVSDHNACTTSAAYDDNWVLKEVNDALAVRSTAVTDSALEDNLFANPSTPPSWVSDSSWFLKQDLETRRWMRSDAPLDSLLLGPHHTDVSGLTIDNHQDLAQYPTSVDLDDVSMFDVHGAGVNLDYHRSYTRPWSDIGFGPPTIGPNGLLVPPHSYPRRHEVRNRNAAMDWNTGAKEAPWTPAAVPEQGYSAAPSMRSSTAFQSFATSVNQDTEMTEAPAIPIINEPPTLAEMHNNFSPDSNAHMPVSVEDGLLSLESQSVNDNDLISDVSSTTSRWSRKLKDRQKTKDVREMGACLRCRIERIPCDSDEQCKSCREFCAENHCPFVPCIRRKLSELLEAEANGFQETFMGSPEADCEAERWKSKDMNDWFESLPKEPTRPGRSAHVVEVRRSPNLSQESLKVTCREVMPQGPERANYPPMYFVPSRSPTDKDICAWSEKDILLEHRTTFGGRIEQCLASYKTAFHHSYVLNERLSPSTRIEAFRLAGLMENAWTMTCMLKIWAYEVKDMFFTGGMPFGLHLLPVQLHLHLQAGTAISIAERDLLEGFDAFLQPPSTLKEETSDTRSAFTIALWLSMWQVILVYQEVLEQLSSADAVTESAKRRSFIRLTEKLFEGVVAMYSSRFRTTAIVKRILDAMDNFEAFGDDNEFVNDLKAAWTARNDFYNELERNEHPNRQVTLLKAYVISREKEVFSKRSAINRVQKQKYGPGV